MIPLIEQWVRPEIRSLSPYHVPDPTQLIKLDAMENPYSWPDSVVNEWLECLRSVGLNRYPDPEANAVKQKLRATLGIPEDQGIILGNGSDELIQIILMTLADPHNVVLAPEPSFVMYRMIAIFSGMRYMGVSLEPENFELDRSAMLESIQRNRPAVLFLAYPNNPTGNLWDRTHMEEIIMQAPGLVVVDEAYAPFASDSFLSSLGDHPNLIVMRTVSKMGLAGLRLGWLTGPQEWLSEFNKVRLPYNINVLTQASVEFALAHQVMFDQQAVRIREDRQALSARLAALPGVTVFPSEANFILFRTPRDRADAIFLGLKQRGVLIKNLSVHGLLKDCLRVTIGTSEENQLFTQALEQTLLEVT
jgi:histidinol-phosphate aminotransferase